MLFNTIVEPEGAESGGHRHALFCIPTFARYFRTTVMVPQFVRKHVRELYLRNLDDVALASTPGGDFVRANRGLALIVRSFCGAFISPADVFYASSGFLPDVIGPSMWRMLRPRTRFVAVVHHLVDLEQRRAAGEGNVLAQIFERLSLGFVRRFATTVVAGNDIVRRQLMDAGVPAERLIVTTNGVRHRIAEAQLDNREKEVLYVGRLSLRKGIGDLCKAWQSVAERHPDWRLTLIGAMEPRDADALQPLIGATPRVRFAGRASEEELQAAFMRAAMFVMPSYEEGWCIAIAEAMASGLPVVSYALPIFDLSFDRGRVAAPIGDAPALASEIDRLITNRDLRGALAREAWNASTRYSWDAAATKELAGLLPCGDA